MTEQRECYIATDAQLTTVEVPPAPDAEVVMLRSELEELRSQLAAAEERLETLRQNYAAEVVERGNTERALAEARAALAKDAPIAQAAREWHQARQRYLATQHSDNWRALVVAVDQSWERLLALIESDAAGQPAQGAGR